MIPPKLDEVAAVLQARLPWACRSRLRLAAAQHRQAYLQRNLPMDTLLNGTVLEVTYRARHHVAYQAWLSGQADHPHGNRGVESFRTALALFTHTPAQPC